MTEFCYTLLPDVGCYELIVNVTPGNSAGNGSSVATSYSPEGIRIDFQDRKCVLCSALFQVQYSKGKLLLKMNIQDFATF